jgi:hypothetical protein
MAYPSYPPPLPPPPPIATTDLVISIGAVILTVAFGVVAAAMGLFSLAFLDYCPPATCSAEGAAAAVGIALLAAFAIGVVGLVVTVIQLVRRKPGWPFAVATFVLCALAGSCWEASGTPWPSADPVSGKSRPPGGSLRLRFPGWNQTI